MAARNDQCRSIREAVCIDTKRVYDSCRDRDCMRDLPVYFPRCALPVIERAVSVKARGIELVWVDIDVEAITFNRGYYSVNVRYYFKIDFDVYTGMTQPTSVSGMAVYDKTVVLFGSEGASKTFTSKYVAGERDCASRTTTNLPEASVEVVSPMILQARLVETCTNPCNSCNPCNNCGCCCGDVDVEALPQCVCGCFEDELSAECEKQVLVTIGLFSIIRISRKVQLLIPIYDFCIPQKDCEGIAGSTEDPCEMFSQFNFPLDDFFPPNKSAFEDSFGSGCGCD